MSFNGLGRNLGNLSWLSEAETRSISAENPTGGKGMGAMADPDGDDHPARELGRGWKCRPYVVIAPIPRRCWPTYPVWARSRACGLAAASWIAISFCVSTGKDKSSRRSNVR